MKIVDSEILEMFTDCDFDDLTSVSYDENILERMHVPEHLKYYYTGIGATKLVFYWDEYDEVIKIPFCGYEDPNYDDDCFIFESANNSINDWDYCRKEFEVYNLISDEHIKQFFAKTRLLGYGNNGYPIYAQEKIEKIGDYDYLEDEGVYDDKTVKVAQDISSRHNENCRSDLPWVTIADIIVSFGQRTADSFMEFLEDMEINDLTETNFGFKDDHIVLTDYSGCWEFQMSFNPLDIGSFGFLGMAEAEGMDDLVDTEEARMNAICNELRYVIDIYDDNAIDNILNKHGFDPDQLTQAAFDRISRALSQNKGQIESKHLLLRKNNVIIYLQRKQEKVKPRKGDSHVRGKGYKEREVCGSGRRS